MLLESLAHRENKLSADAQRAASPGSLGSFSNCGRHSVAGMHCQVVPTRTIFIVVAWGSLLTVSSSTVWWKGEIPENHFILGNFLGLTCWDSESCSESKMIKYSSNSPVPVWSGQTLKPIRLQIIQGGVRVKSILHSAPGTWVKIPEIRNLKNYNNTQGQTNVYYLVSSLKTRLAYDWGTSQVSVAWELWWKTDIQVRHAKGVCPRGSLWQTLGIPSVWTPIGQHTSLRRREINK